MYAEVHVCVHVPGPGRRCVKSLGLIPCYHSHPHHPHAREMGKLCQKMKSSTEKKCETFLEKVVAKRLLLSLLRSRGH